jgi:quercetin dioxygenase-like cupin family protein
MSNKAILSSDKPDGVSLSDLVTPVGNGIVSRTVLNTPELRAVEFAFAEGQELTEHTSTSRALIQILTGACDFVVAGETRKMRAGDLLHLVPRVPHALRATEPMTMLLVLAPERKA